jgi:hypothetical protein
VSVILQLIRRVSGFAPELVISLAYALAVMVQHITKSLNQLQEWTDCSFAPLGKIHRALWALEITSGVSPVHPRLHPSEVISVVKHCLE